MTSLPTFWEPVKKMKSNFFSKRAAFSALPPVITDTWAGEKHSFTSISITFEVAGE